MKNRMTEKRANRVMDDLEALLRDGKKKEAIALYCQRDGVAIPSRIYPRMRAIRRKLEI